MKTLRTILPAIFNQIKQGSTFLAIKGYINNSEEKSDNSIVFHVNYHNAIKKSLMIFNSYRPTNIIEEKVRQELIESYTTSLTGYNPRARSAHAYTGISDGNSLIRGVKWHDRYTACHLWGFVVHKRIITPGNYLEINSGASSIVRQKLLGMTPLSKFRQFKIIQGRFNSIGVEKLSLTDKDLLKNI